MISVYGGTGFIGKNFISQSKFETSLVPKNGAAPISNKILYCIGTTDNYNVLTNSTLDIETNLLLLVKNLDLIRSKFKTFEFNFLSSWFVYGTGQTPPFKESGGCDPRGFYSISKFSAELYLRSYCESFGINYRIIRLANVFGRNDLGISKKKNALQYLISEIRANRDVDLYHGGNFLRDYIDVRDVVTALDLIMGTSQINEVYNVGSGNPSKFLDLLEEVKKSSGSSSTFRSVDPPEFHKAVQVKDSWLNTDKIMDLGFKVMYPINREVKDL